MQGDYIAIEDNLVHSNTWWGSSAESAIVIAEATHIDQEEGCGDTRALLSTLDPHVFLCTRKPVRVL